MTLVVGILCTDGVVIGTDSAATMSSGGVPTIEQPYREKVTVFNNQVIIAGTGEIGLGQRFEHCVRRCWKNKGFDGNNAVDVGCNLAHESIKNFRRTDLDLINFGALIAFPHNSKPAMIEFVAGKFQPEVKTKSSWYVSMGSGQQAADPLLGMARKMFWGDSPPNLRAGIFAATMVLTLGCEMAPHGVSSPIQMALLFQTKNGGYGAKKVGAEELQESIENVDGALKHFGKHVDGILHRSKPKDHLPQGPG